MTLLQTLLGISGGLGLFLLGMIIMTDGLRALAAESMRRVLTRFTRSAYSGAATGALTTAVLQSSSATTVAAVGFVGAGLLSFSQSLGIIFGANIGTTITGWLVAWLGLKLDLASVMLPLVLFGAVLKLFAHTRIKQLGMALAGFALIFIGIEMLQAGMSGLEANVIPLHLPQDSWTTRLQFVALGILFTVITQSSSAGVAASLTALYTGTIEFHHAAALIIGMDIGTTFTAVIATIGGTSDMRRTGLSHVIYNLLTGIMAFLLLTPYIHLITLWQGELQTNAEFLLVAFHSGFNILGVLLVLPFTENFSRLMLRLIPENTDPLIIELDRSLLKEPSVALTASQAVLAKQLQFLLGKLMLGLNKPRRIEQTPLIHFQQTLATTQSYVDNIHLSQENKPQWQRLYAITHGQDHLQRFYHRILELNDLSAIIHSAEFLPLRQQLRADIERLQQLYENNLWQEAEELSSLMAHNIDAQTDRLRDDFIAAVANDTLDVPVANDYLHTLRWLNRVATHIYRLSFYLTSAAYPEQSPATIEASDF